MGSGVPSVSLEQIGPKGFTQLPVFGRTVPPRTFGHQATRGTPILKSVNLGVPVNVPWGKELVTTAVFKKPVKGRVRVGFLGLSGDLQADRKVHGGVLKAVYSYPSEHYAYWAKVLGEELPWGAFGENLTTAGLAEVTLHPGDMLRVGTAAFEVTTPRTPCFKLGIRFGRRDMPNLFEESGMSGFYLKVDEEGFVEAGDRIHLIGGSEAGASISEMFRSLVGD
jgi:MOSC domain-containing protein YiiM